MVQVDKQQRKLLLVALALLDLLLQSVAQHAPVGQPGQGVVKSLLAYQRLRLPAAGNIGEGADHAQRFAIGVPADHHAPAEHPLPAPVLAQDAALTLVTWRAAFKVVFTCLAQQFQIVGMGAVVKLLRAAVQVVAFVAAHLQQAFGKEFGAGLYMPVPDAVARTFQRQLPPLFTLPRCGLGQLAVGDVLQYRRAFEWAPTVPGGRPHEPYPDGSPAAGDHLQLHVVRGHGARLILGLHGANHLQRLRGEKSSGGGQVTRLEFLWRHLQNTVHTFGPECGARNKVTFPRSHAGDDLRCVQQFVKVLAIRFGAHIVADIGKGAYHATGWQVLCSHFQCATLRRHAQIVLGQRVHSTGAGVDHMASCLGVHQLRIRTEIATLQLVQYQFLHCRQTGQQPLRQVQQFADTGVELAHPTKGVEQQDTLADAGQRGLQKLRVFQQLRIECAQLVFCQFARRDVGVGTYHPHGRTLCVALDDHATGQYPFPTAVFAAHAKVNRVLRGPSIHVGKSSGLNHGQIIGVHQAFEILIALVELTGRKAQHLLPMWRVGLLTGQQIPIPDPHAGAFQRQFPRIFTRRGRYQVVVHR